MLTDKELSAIVQAWGNEPTQRNIVDLCRDVAKAQKAAERERCAKLADEFANRAWNDSRSEHWSDEFELLAANIRRA